MIQDISNKLLKSISYESQGSMTLMNQRPASFAEHEETHALRTTTVPKDSGVYSFQSTTQCLKIEGIHYADAIGQCLKIKVKLLPWT